MFFCKDLTLFLSSTIYSIYVKNILIRVYVPGTGLGLFSYLLTPFSFYLISIDIISSFDSISSLIALISVSVRAIF